MLEEPECGAPGARAAAGAMDCKGRAAFPVKKLIQARLPFKRLNLVPKEKDEAATGAPRSPTGAVRRPGPRLAGSLDNVENDCLASEGGLVPPLLNGEGPLDGCLRTRAQESEDRGAVIIDLTEDSCELPAGPTGHSPLQAEAAAPGKAVNGVGVREQPGLPEAIPKAGPALPGETLADGPCAADEGAVGSRGAGRCCDPQEGRAGWRAAGGILCRGKVPVVLLQDILAATPARSRPASESDQPEPDSAPSPSSLSSSSPSSSPEGQPAPKKRRSRGSPSPSSTPVDRVSKKLIREKNKLRLQRDREELREQRERLREAARQAKEEARRKREAEKEVRERERREKRAKDQEEKAAKLQRKEEQRRARQEALEAKLEEKRRKEEEKRLREEEKRIKAEKAEITRFFQKPKTPQAPKTLAGSCGKFAPFEIKEHMVLAPQSRAAFGQDLCRQLDQLLRQQDGDGSFLKDLKSRRPLRSGPTGLCRRSAELLNSDVVIVGGGGGDGVPERRKFGRMKLLQFSENHRPAYWGTWNKTTTVIRPRDPWARDWTLLDYEVDSDEEWEEEEPGESLSHSEGDDDDDVGEDEDEDDGFFVPHGYLSEDEGVTEECADPENHKVRQKLKAKEWDEFLAKGKRFRVLQPVQIGCVWAAAAGGCAGADLRVLQQFTACFLDTAPADDEQTPKASKREKRDQQILAQLLPLLHGNVHGSKVIIREFQERCRRGLLGQDAGSPPSPGCSRPQTPTAAEDSAVPSKARLKRLISENSVYEKRPDFRMCWYVHPRVLKSFDQEHLPVPCQWSYVTSVPSAPREDGGPAPAAPPGQATPVALKRKSAGSMCITQFMKKRRQVGAADMDGFQADTEEEEEEDGDCVIVAIPDAGGVPCGTGAGAAAGMDSTEGALPAGLLGAS